ncbi:S8 family peptidase [Novosphingobium sp. SL115]|uniref:S8 family peptidase n=1 Tax=Novosphingobium sp. SL115 TaxID=2995150 RepID=UPI00227619C2|nr:S8 family peptidase [Novosphingobium sp. SL115]MCY1669548.1 S8 family peptidase [Novosphingobium sp. SL115]
MADVSARPHSHFYWPASGNSTNYTAYPPKGNGSVAPERDRATHAQQLTQALTEVVAAGETLLASRDPQIASGTPGFYIEFILPSGQAQMVDKLERKGKFPIELVSVQPADELHVAATVFVPESQRGYYLGKVEAYGTKDNVKVKTLDDGSVVETRKPKNERLVASIETARLAVARSFYTDAADLFPTPNVKAWWEVWLRKGTRAQFEAAAQTLGLPLRETVLEFAEREVCIVHASAEDLGRIIANTETVAELRMARDTPAFFMGIDGAEQHLWSDDLAGRLDPCGADAPAVCLLDSGTTISHALIAPLLSPADQQACEAGWHGEDVSLQGHGGHGTQLSGIALYGDLTDVLASAGPVTVRHRLESVKILPDHGANDPDLYGAITARAIARAEITAPNRPRAICLAVTSPGDHWRGRPSSWSAKLDELAFGRDEIPRIITVSAGNIREAINAADYPDRNDLMPIESPAQAWNALTVGAFTEKSVITDTSFAGWNALAGVGDIAARSRTSVSWHRDWPLKPDVMFEGGNIGIDPGSGMGDHVDDLALLTTYRKPTERPFTTTGDTSAATALGARMAAQILAEKPALWPETVRGLIVHSAEWTPAMTGYLGTLNRISLVRRYGFGAPSLVRALGSLDNDVTMVVEDSLIPFKMEKGKAVTDQLMVHELVWPKKKLAELGEVLVQLRLTLSYFIEPNPGERGQSRRHSYASHGLRFALKPADEKPDVFLRRITSEAGPRPPARQASDTGWTIGPQLRHRGSLHADIWEGTAADLAERNSIIIYPTGGWWRENLAQDRVGETARYSLIASIRAADGIDLRTEISAQIAPEITGEAVIEV